MGWLNISDGMAKTTTQNKLITPLANHIIQTASDQNKNAIRKTHPSGKQYLDFPETSEGPKYLHTFTRRRAGAGSWEIIEKIAILLISCIIKDQKRKTQGIRNFRLKKLNFAR